MIRLRPDVRAACCAGGVATLLFGALSSVAAAEDAVAAGYWAMLERAAHRGLMQEVAAAGGRPTPFATDGCSGGLSAIWRQFSGREETADGPPFEACCVAHDLLYHDADGIGSSGRILDGRDEDLATASQQARLAADQALRRCVETQLSSRESPTAAIAAPVATAMYAAVRFGGAPCSGLSWRWGYGYGHCQAVFGR
ncbi:hypothetical protein VWZ88_07725 [Phaeobacter sp. JH20_36]|uniref:hypothetical protein n=3 Tax=Phaeobacter TaxID=302485 RepID=UPI003A8851F6